MKCLGTPDLELNLIDNLLGRGKCISESMLKRLHLEP